MRVFEGAVPLDLKRRGSPVGPPATMTLSESRIARFLCVPVMGSDCDKLPPAAGTGPWSTGPGFEFKHGRTDPKGGELYPATAKSWETVMEAGKDADVQIALLSGA